MPVTSELPNINRFMGVYLDMRNQSIAPMIMVMTFFIILSVSIAGCTSQAPSALPVTDKNLSTIEPSQMALQPSEVPGNFTLVEKAERNVSDMSSWAVDQGWKKGYYAVWQMNDQSLLPGTVFEQYISVYPANNISLIVPDTVYMVKNWSAQEENVNISVVDELPLPTIGDSSSALRIFDKSNNTEEYIVAFVKKDVFQEFYTNGTAADYETARQLAIIAAAKIK
jgi:hypothetical protein